MPVYDKCPKSQIVKRRRNLKKKEFSIFETRESELSESVGSDEDGSNALLVKAH